MIFQSPMGGAHAASGIVLLVAMSSTASAAPSHLCRAGETALFACQIEKADKLLSLCEGRTLIYRFGRSSKVELEYPPPEEEFPEFDVTVRQASGRHSSQASFSVTFRMGTTEYKVASDEFAGGGSTDRTGGVTVTTGPGKQVTLKCAATSPPGAADATRILAAASKHR